MSARLPLALPFVVLAALALTGCKDKQQPAAAPQASRDCCCKQACPTDAAPATEATARADADSGAVTRSGERRQAARRGYRARTYDAAGDDYYASGDTTGRRYRGGYTGRDTSSSYESGYGGRYGASGRAIAGVSVSVEESETSSERVRYRESSSGYASGSSGGYAAGYAATGYYEDRDGRVRRAGPAATDHSGYLTWPGKVEEED